MTQEKKKKTRRKLLTTATKYGSIHAEMYCLNGLFKGKLVHCNHKFTLL